MPYMGDTNILLRFGNPDDPGHPDVRDAVRILLERGEPLYYTQQSRREFWDVATRPEAQNGLGLNVDQTVELLRVVDAVFTRLPDRPESGSLWDALVIRHQVTGRAVHDAQIVASMLSERITHLLTLNARDFARYAEITVITPGVILAEDRAD